MNEGKGVRMRGGESQHPAPFKGRNPPSPHSVRVSEPSGDHSVVYESLLGAILWFGIVRG